MVFLSFWHSYTLFEHTQCVNTVVRENWFSNQKSLAAIYCTPSTPEPHPATNIPHVFTAPNRVYIASEHHIRGWLSVLHTRQFICVLCVFATKLFDRNSNGRLPCVLWKASIIYLYSVWIDLTTASHRNIRKPLSFLLTCEIWLRNSRKNWIEMCARDASIRPRTGEHHVCHHICDAWFWIETIILCGWPNRRTCRRINMPNIECIGVCARLVPYWMRNENEMRKTSPDLAQVRPCVCHGAIRSCFGNFHGGFVCDPSHDDVEQEEVVVDVEKIVFCTSRKNDTKSAQS